MSQVTAITTTPPVTVVCFRASPIAITVMMADTAVGLVAVGQHDVVLLPQLILRDTMRDVVGLSTVL